MRERYIDFISAYCDRWCERCAFTDRCSSFAVTIAESMCDGDLEAAIELAIGAPQTVGAERQPPLAERIGRTGLDVSVSDDDVNEGRKAEKARCARLDNEPVARLADSYTMQAADWLRDHREPLSAGADPVLREALDIVGWDVWLIGAKLHRALRGRDESRSGEIPDEDRVQNDWNGTAKVALISLGRSESAWQTIAQAANDPQAAAFADLVAQLRHAAVREFPDARAFRRPGFDDGPAAQV